MKRLFLCCVILSFVACSRVIPAGLHKSVGDTFDARGNLAKAMQSMLDAKSYRARVESSTSSGTTSTTSIEFVAPDHFHLTREATTPGHPPTKRETIVVGAETWMKMGDAPWQKFPADLSDTIKQFRDPEVINQIAKSLDVKVVGTEVLEGTPTTIYQYTLGNPDNKDFNISAKTWVGAGDGLPHKTESEGDLNLAGRQIHTKSIITYYDYGADITINKPLG
jgi:hypothetical protein